MNAREPDPRDEQRPSSAEDAYARLLALRESGSAPDFETWVRAFPEFERELRELDGSWERVERSLERVLGSTVLVPPPPLVPSLQRGAQVGEFVLERLIGAGGMGIVWLARQASLDREVALKFVRPDRASVQSPELFAREARAAGRANDARIVTVFAVGESDGLRWLAMEHVPGSRSLATWLGDLRAAGAPAGHARQAAAFVADVAEALHAAHQVGVVHRDVKPQNVLIAPDGSPKLTDFGLARLIDEEALSETLTIRGTVEYMSPEQVTGDTHGLDHRSDVFSLGVLLYELLTLERPFTGVTPIEVITRIAAREARRPSEVAAGIEPELDVIVGKALEKRPEERYASAQDLARDLRRWLAHEPIAARPPSSWRRLVKWMRRNPVPAVVIAATAVLLVVSVVFVKRLVDKGEQLREQQGRQHVVEALWNIDGGKLDAAAEQVASFYARGLQDPEAHLVMAMGYGRYLRFSDAEAELEQAVRLGFSPELPDEPTGNEVYLRGLWLLAQRGPERNREAAQLLQRAVELEPNLTQVWLPLYQLHHSLGEVGRARHALEQFIKTTPESNDYWSISKALLERLDGARDQAIETLVELRARVTDERAVELRLDRHLGFAYLDKARGVALEDPAEVDPAWLDAAERHLVLAQDDTPKEGNALAALGMVFKLRADAEPDAGSKRRLLERAEEYGERAVDMDSGLERAAELRAMLAYDLVACDFSTRIIDEGDLDSIELRLESLRELVPGSNLIPILESGLAYYRGAFANDRGEFDDAREFFADSVASSDRQLYARVMLGQRLAEDRREFAQAKDLFREALELWDSGLLGVPGEDPSRERKWLLAASAWLFAAADQSGDPQTARAARDRALDELWKDDNGMQTAEMLTLAEYLATAKHSELRDCEVARQLVEDRGLEAAWGWHHEGRRVLDAIDEHCGD